MQDNATEKTKPQAPEQPIERKDSKAGAVEDSLNLEDVQPKEPQVGKSKLIDIPKLSGKEPSTTLKHLDYILNFANHLNKICNLLSDSDPNNKYTAFYQLCITGEIIAKQDILAQKLPDQIRGLFPDNVCMALQDLRDNHIVHDIFYLSKYEDEIYNTFRDDQ